MSVRNESNGFVSIVYYGLVALATVIEMKQLQSIIPLNNPLFTPTNETSANEKVSEIMMFSFDHSDYYCFGLFNFSSCAARATVVSGVAKRAASKIKLEKPSLDLSPTSFAEFESDSEGKDPTYVPLRAKNRKTVEYEKWDEDLFRSNEAKLGLKSAHHLCSAAPVECVVVRTVEEDEKKPSAKSNSKAVSQTSSSSRNITVPHQLARNRKVMSDYYGGYRRSRHTDVQSVWIKSPHL